MTAADILIIVPKADELYWIGLALGFDFSSPDRMLYEDKPIYDRTLQDGSGNAMSLAFIAMDAQGNTETALLTREAIEFLRPTLAFLVGTALGNPARTAVGDVVFAQQITDISETKALEKGRASWRSRHVEPTGRMRRDVGRFRETVRANNLRKIRSRFRGFASEHLPDREKIGSFPRSLHLEAVASGDVMIADPGLAARIWQYDDRLACYDMESGGFARALGGQRGQLPPDSESGENGAPTHYLEWMTVRGISDFGDAESKTELNRQTASAAAGIALAAFLEEGLKECHPFQLRPPTTESATGIPGGHFYVQKSGTQYFRDRIYKDLGVELPIEQPSRQRTLSALAALLYPLTDRSRGELLEYLRGLREHYFEDKYFHYTYEHDLRSLLPGWAIEFREFVRGDLNMPRAGSDVLDVGVGNGLELEPLFGESGVLPTRSVIGVDISAQMLEAAKKRFVHLTPLQTSAEELDGVDSRSIDLYVSLRTYMSRAFDVPRALEEAVRVLRPTGGIVLSIANGYVVENGSTKRRIVRGLTVSGGKAVDAHEPHSIAQRLRRHLWDFGFDSVGYHSSATDVYIWGRAPTAGGRQESR